MNGITNIGEILNDLEIDRDAWQARAEATEKELESALAIVDLYQERMFTAEKRVAELEAADRWRPVTEPPKDNGDYLVYCWPGEYEVMTFWDGYWAGGIPIYHWQPLPAPPQDTPASGRHEGEE